MDYQTIISFWFEETDPKLWFQKSEEFDRLIATRFLDYFQAAAAGELLDWRDQALGRLAEIICLDQFPRNIFRNDPRSFATDGMALVLAQEAVRAGAAQNLEGSALAFLYMPYMHSESSAIHELALTLFSDEKVKDNLAYEIAHKKIIDRFGRYPHRNEILGRKSTVEELAFLQEAGSSF